MKRKENFDLYNENQRQASLLPQEYKEVYDSYLNYLLKNKKDTFKLNLLAALALEKLEDASKKGIKADTVLLKDYAKESAKLKKSKNIKEVQERILQRDYEKYTVSNIWSVFTFFIVLLFVKNLIMKDYLLAFSIDVLVAILAALVALRSEFIKYKIMNRYGFSKRYLSMDAVAFIVCLIVKVVSKTNFDITFMVLVLEYFFTQKAIKKEFNKINDTL